MFHASVVADGLYDSATNREMIASKDMVVYIPVRKRHKEKAPFAYDPGGNQLTCPSGRELIGRVRQERGTLFTFSPRRCLPCQDHPLCPPLNHGRVRVYVSDDQRAAWAMPPDSTAVVEQERKRIERKFGEAKLVIQAPMTFRDAASP